MANIRVLVLVSIVALMVGAGCSRQNENNNQTAAVPNANCQYLNQPGCWGASPYTPTGYQAYGAYGCQGQYQQVMYPPYGAGCMPNNYMTGYTPYYQNYGYTGGSYGAYGNYGTGYNYGSQPYAVACDMAYPQTCSAGTFCRDVGMGRIGICSHY